MIFRDIIPEKNDLMSSWRLIDGIKMISDIRHGQQRVNNDRSSHWVIQAFRVCRALATMVIEGHG
jgi:hypothetical protein